MRTHAGLGNEECLTPSLSSGPRVRPSHAQRRVLPAFPGTIPDPMDEPIEVPIEDWIDLHTFQPREVAEVVEEYLYQALQKGFRQVRIIHGRGIGIQRGIVHSILERHPQVASFSDTPDRGATIVLLLPARAE